MHVRPWPVNRRILQQCGLEPGACATREAIRRSLRYTLAAACIVGGQGIAIVVESFT